MVLNKPEFLREAEGKPEPIRSSDTLVKGLPPDRGLRGFFRPVLVSARLALREKRLAITLIVFALLHSATNGGSILFIKEFLEGMLEAGDVSMVWVGAILLLIIWVVRVGSRLAFTILQFNLARAVEMHARIDVLTHLMRLSVGFLEGQSRAEFIQRVGYDTSAIREGMAAFIQALTSFLTVIGLVVVAFLIDPYFTFLGIVAFPLGLPLLVLTGRRLEASAGMQRKSSVKLVDMLMELLNGIRIIRAYGGEEREEGFQRDICREIYHYLGRTEAWRASALAVPEMALGVGLVLIVAVGGGRLVTGDLSWPSLLGFLLATLALQSPLGQIIQAQATLRSRQPYADRYFELLELEPQVKDPDEPVPVPEGVRDIEFRNVTYEAGGETILKDVSIRIRAGETIGIVGPTGAGKTTLLNLAARFVDPTEGTVLYGGKDVRSFRQREFMERLAIVTQDPFLFAADIQANISYGDPDASELEIRQALRLAGVLEEVDAMPMGLASRVGLGGRPVSGGQRQRLNLARALLKGAPLLLLDEATSHLDSVTEEEVQEAIESHLGTHSVTTLLIAHRLSTLRSADRILVLEKGDVVGLATHEELLLSSETYRRLVGTQQVGLGAPPQPV